MKTKLYTFWYWWIVFFAIILGLYSLDAILEGMMPTKLEVVIFKKITKKHALLCNQKKLFSKQSIALCQTKYFFFNLIAILQSFLFCCLNKKKFKKILLTNTKVVKCRKFLSFFKDLFGPCCLVIKVQSHLKTTSSFRLRFPNSSINGDVIFNGNRSL